jgi:hypothetical protein
MKMSAFLCGMLLWSLLVAVPGVNTAGQQAPPRPTVPLESVLDAFRTHDVVSKNVLAEALPK